MIDGPYRCGGYADIDGKFYVQGPGNGFSYNHDTLWPKSRFDSKEAMKDATVLLNQAYIEWYQQAKCDIRKALEL